MDQSEGSEASLDSAFEPTIDELVNDFDDEQTLNEEESLAAKEQSNPLDEIEALKEEGDMPLEELLAKYSLPQPITNSMPMHEMEPRRKKKKSSHKKHSKNKIRIKLPKPIEEAVYKPNVRIEDECTAANGQPTVCILIDSDDEEEMPQKTVNTVSKGTREIDEVVYIEDTNDVEVIENNSSQDKVKIRRSHLFDLYPEQNFDDAIVAAHGGAIALETLYSEGEEEEGIEEEENDPDYVKKTIMVGSAFQAVIPGLSQYGDVLPYENEDKLVWEPSQVSEAEVEEYLLKVRDIKPNVNDEENDSLSSSDKSDSETVNTDADTYRVSATGQNVSSQNDELEIEQKENIKSNEEGGSPTNDFDVGSVVKDNEQALHLLVQCGYDFKEALRRKRLNAVPLTGGNMSLWSDEECQKFEEGIQKFGKDFFKIRQHQVRTRTMRELVQFYYLWKKSERRDHNFANADTVDHMDIYLNEGEDYSSSPGSVPLTTGSATANCRKLNGCNQNNFSIMTGNISPTKVKGNGNVVGSKKRTLSDSNNIQVSGNSIANATSHTSGKCSSGTIHSCDHISSVSLHNTLGNQQK